MFFRRSEYKRPFGDRPPPQNPYGGLVIIVIGTILILGHHFITSHFEKQKRIRDYRQHYTVSIDQCDVPPLTCAARQKIIEQHNTEEAQKDLNDYLDYKIFTDEIDYNDFVQSEEELPAGKIVLIIDDMGMDVARSKQVIDLGVPMTLAFLPYAPRVQDLTEEARKKGHELIIHIPMEPVDSNVSLGGMGLTEDMSAATFDQRLDEIFNSFSGYVGVNNHMGSQLTQNEAAMRQLMIALKKRDKFFIDSRTINTSVAADIARLSGVPTATRDVFLDHIDTPEGIHAALKKAENIARKNGTVIVIGHPKDTTIQGLREWLPTLADKHITIIPARIVVK